MNGLSFDIHREEEAVELFAENILEAGVQFLERSSEAPFIPTVEPGVQCHARHL
jgi:glucosyl-3-phosphoglycerate synthase